LGDPIFDKNDARSTKVDDNALVARAGEPTNPFRRLRATAKEVQAIGTSLHEENNFVALDDKATESTLKHASDSGELKRYRFIHLATHGMLGSKKNEPPALVFGLEAKDDSNAANDGFLRLDEVTRLDLNADLVALSACQTGQGQNRRGEGVTSMARAFLLAGSRNVLCSLWSVDDAKTADLMTAMYSRLSEGSNAADALRAAQLQMIDRAEPPYYWAAFIASGR
jgi:CHAT domain-containing protein